MTKSLRLGALATTAALGMALSPAPSHAHVFGWVGYKLTCDNGDKVEWMGPNPAQPNYAQHRNDRIKELCPGGASSDPQVAPPFGTRTFTLTSAYNLPVRSADMIDLNMLTDERTIEALGIDRATIGAIREAQTLGAFTGAEDFAVRVCAKTNVTLRASAIRVGTMEYRSTPVRDPRRAVNVRPAPVFSCVAGSGTYEVVGRAHNYVGHVTLLR